MAVSSPSRSGSGTGRTRPPPFPAPFPARWWSAPGRGASSVTARRSTGGRTSGPLTNGEIAEKYMENACLTVDGARAVAIRNAVLDLDRYDDVRALAGVLAG